MQEAAVLQGVIVAMLTTRYHLEGLEPWIQRIWFVCLFDKSTEVARQATVVMVHSTKGE